MILVTLGTQKQSFARLLDAVDKADINEEIVVQAGYTKYENKKMKIFDFISYEEMDKLVDSANIIITHGGTGSIVGPLKKNKKIIAAARLSKYGEHVDDHQIQIVDMFADVGYIMKYEDGDNLKKIIEEIKSKKMLKFKSNNKCFIKKLSEEIGK